MAVPESQLATWSNQGAVTTAAATRASIYAALAAASQLAGKRVDVYLQGSYKNTTNIYADSDVDVVTQLDDIFIYDTSALPPDQRGRLEADLVEATYSWTAFDGDVLAALQDYYGAAKAKAGNKAIKLAAASGRLPADIVPAVQYRRYISYVSPSNQSYEEGIWFKGRDDGRAIINYPKQHYDNGVRKNAASRTREQFKPSVRMFKNARNRLVELGMLAEDGAPSYFLQCLLYNVPDACFKADRRNTYCEVVNWLLDASLADFVCQNEQLTLFGETPEQWTVGAASTVIAALVELWNEW